jgi:two-component system sensor kinase FixL
MGEVSATLAHELKTPLSGMMLSATRLKKALKKRDDAGKLVAITEQLESAISTLSETVSHASGMIRKPVLELKDTDLNETIEEALTLFEPRAEGQGVRILREYAARLPMVKADGNVLMRAFLNLIENALDVMPASGILRLETRKAGDDHVEAVVSDTGPGIDPEKAESLFQPFFSEKKGGTGLGLAVVRKIVELHEGTVSLRPAGGRGTEAVVRFPFGEVRPSESVVSMV